MSFSSLLNCKEKHHNILPLKCLKVSWSIVHKQQNRVIDSSAYLRIENFIEPIPTCWNVNWDMLLCSIFERTFLIYKIQSMLACCISKLTLMVVCDNMWHLHKPPYQCYSSFCFFFFLNWFELSVGKTKPYFGNILENRPEKDA